MHDVVQTLTHKTLKLHYLVVWGTIIHDLKYKGSKQCDETSDSNPEHLLKRFEVDRQVLFEIRFKKEGGKDGSIKEVHEKSITRLHALYNLPS